MKIELLPTTETVWDDSDYELTPGYLESTALSDDDDLSGIAFTDESIWPAVSLTCADFDTDTEDYIVRSIALRMRVAMTDVSALTPGAYGTLKAQVGPIPNTDPALEGIVGPHLINLTAAANRSVITVTVARWTTSLVPSDPVISLAAQFISTGPGALPTSAGRLAVTRAWIEVEAIVRPYVSDILPEGTLDETNLPLLRWTPVLDPDGGPAVAFEAAITGPGEAPDVVGSTIYSTSGIVYSDETSWQSDEALQNGDYSVYVRVAQMVDGELFWSEWDTNLTGIEVDTTTPALPDIVLVPENGAQRMRIDVSPASSLVTNPDFEEGASAWINEGSDAEKRRVTELMGLQAIQGEYAMASEVGDTASKCGLQTTSHATTLGALHRYSIYIAATLDLRLESVLEEKTTTTVHSEATAVEGDGEWHRYTDEWDFGTGDHYAFHVRTPNGDPQNGTFMVDGLQVVTAPNELTDYIQIEKRQAGAVEWLRLRTPLGDGLVTDAETAWDAECANGTAMEYRARSIHVHAENAWAYSAWTPIASDFVSWDMWSIKHPFLPDLNLTTRVRSQPSRTREVFADVAHILGRSSPAVTHDSRACWAGQITFRSDNQDMRDQLQAITADGSPLLIQAPGDPVWRQTWVMLTDSWESERIIDHDVLPLTFDQFAWVQVERPETPMLAWPAWFVESDEED